MKELILYKKLRSALSLLVGVALIIFLTSCPGSPNISAEALVGQWMATIDDSSKTIIDIQYTKPGYWIMGELDETSNTIVETTPAIESNRTQEEEGWFVVSYWVPEEGKTEIRYRFKDGDPNILEAVVYSTGKQYPLTLTRVTNPFEFANENLRYSI